jgi:hypothetical protein
MLTGAVQAFVINNDLPSHASVRHDVRMHGNKWLAGAREMTGCGRGAIWLIQTELNCVDVLSHP